MKPQVYCGDEEEGGVEEGQAAGGASVNVSINYTCALMLGLRIQQSHIHSIYEPCK